MTLKRMDNVLIVVDDLEAVKAFFIALPSRQSLSAQLRYRTDVPIQSAWSAKLRFALTGRCQTRVDALNKLDGGL